MNWETIYRRKVTDAASAVSCIESGNRLYVGGGAGGPARLIDELCARAPELRDVELIHILTFIDAPYVDPCLSCECVFGGDLPPPPTSCEAQGHPECCYAVGPLSPPDLPA